MDQHGTKFKLRELRDECARVTGVPMSQRRLCREAGLSETVVCLAERYGKLCRDSADKIARALSRELGRTVLWWEVYGDEHIPQDVIREQVRRMQEEVRERDRRDLENWAREHGYPVPEAERGE